MTCSGWSLKDGKKPTKQKWERRGRGRGHSMGSGGARCVGGAAAADGETERMNETVQVSRLQTRQTFTGHAREYRHY